MIVITQVEVRLRALEAENQRLSRELKRVEGMSRRALENVSHSSANYVTVSPVGDMHWFDVPSLIEAMESMRTADPAMFADWIKGPGADTVNRVVRILTWVDAKQNPFGSFKVDPNPATEAPR